MAWPLWLSLVVASDAFAAESSETNENLHAAAKAGPIKVIARLRAPDAATAAPGTGSELAVRGRMAGAGVARMRRLGNLPLVALEVDARQLDALLASGNVASVTPDRLLRPALQESVPLIAAPAVWSAGFRGTGRAVAIVDTGVDGSHPFLKGKVIAEACFSMPGTASSLCKGQASGPGRNAGHPCGLEGCEHGTHVAGIAAGRGKSFSGVAPDARLIAVQVFSRVDDGRECEGNPPCLRAAESDLIAALDYLAGIAKAKRLDAVNLSLSATGPDGRCDREPIKDAIDQLRRQGVATVIASGNNGTSNNAGFPGCVSSAITVAATTGGPGSEQIAGFSNMGAEVDLLAPGQAITSSVPGTGFQTESGTSMAAPHVTGAFALLRSASAASSVTKVEQALESTGKSLRRGITRPRIDLAKALTALRARRTTAAPAF
jgi:subtilisin family serine protease